MTGRVLLALVHLVGFGIGLGSIWARGRSFQNALDGPGLRRLFAADSWWGVSAILLIGSGLWRLLASVEKPTDYYLHNHVFWLKMTALIAILLLELWPMMTLIRWRVAVAKGQSVDTSPAARFAAISYAQALLLIVMVAAATAMARGVGAGSGS
jgi:putative membrane protein